MSISALSVRRPVATSMVFLAIVAVGLMAFLRLRVDLLPELSFPSISIVVVTSASSGCAVRASPTAPIGSITSSAASRRFTPAELERMTHAVTAPITASAAAIGNAIARHKTPSSAKSRTAQPVMATAATATPIVFPRGRSPPAL